MGISYEEALSIFKEVGLPNNYNEKDLLKAYRKLAKKYHPDNNKGNEDAKQSMQRVNEARITLKNNLGRTTQTYIKYRTAGPNTKYRNTKIQYKYDKLNLVASYNISYIEIISLGLNNPDYELLKKEMLKLLKDYRTAVEWSTSINETDELFNEFKKYLKRYYVKFMRLYFSYYGIDEKKINTNFNYDLPLDKFYLSLQESKKDYINNLLDNIFNKYTLYSNYDKVRKEIEKYRNNVFNYLQDKSLTLESYYINNIDNDILNIFKYQDNKEKYDKLVEEVKEINDKNIINDVNSLVNYLTTNEFTELYQKISKKIAVYKELEKNKEYISNLYKNIFAKAHLALANIDSPEQINNILETLKNIINLFQSYTKGEIDFNILVNITKITFTDFLEDKRLIDILANNIDPNEISNIYIAFKGIDISLLKLIKENDENYLVYPLINDITKIPLKYNIYNLTLLEEFINNATEYFAKGYNEFYEHEIICLYKYNNIVLCLDNDNLLLINGNLISNIHYLENNEYAEYKDRDLIKNRIIEQFESELTQIENKKQR